MKAVILAGGRGTRLGEASRTMPKPMVEIGAKPILWHIMKIYAAHGVQDFIICLGHKGRQIKEYFLNYARLSSDLHIDLASGTVKPLSPASEPWRITLIDTGEDTETGGRLRQVTQLIQDDEAFLLTYGDGLGDVDITASIAFHHAHGKLATVTAVVPPGRFGALTRKGNQVHAFTEKPAGDGGHANDSTINGGFFVLSPQVLDYIPDDATKWEDAPLHQLAAAGQLMAFDHAGFWQPMDTIRDRDHLRALWDEGHAPWKIW